MFQFDSLRRYATLTRRAMQILAVCVALAWALPAAAQQSVDGDAFRKVITAQVDAFRSDAWSDAFSYASPNIRRLFGSADRFRAMVLDGYEAVARPQVFEFEDATVMNGRPTQPVFIVGPDGVAKRALYFMERQDDGVWKIDGVVLLPLDDRTT